MEKVQTSYQAVVAVKLPVDSISSGGGWNFSVEDIYRNIPIGGIIEVSTTQTPEGKRVEFCTFTCLSLPEGDTYRVTEQSFETLGRLIACGAMVQIQGTKGVV